jgi:hypothetical protein
MPNMGFHKMSQLPSREQLENHNKPEEVRQRLAAGKYTKPDDAIAQEYLDSVDREVATKASARAEAREDRMLSITSDALSIAKEDLSIARSSAESAREQARWAMWAAIIATVAAIITMFKA